MIHNVGKADRSLRAVVGVLVLSLGYYMQTYWGAIGLVLLATSAFSFCPLYSLIGFSSCPLNQKEQEKDILS